MLTPSRLGAAGLLAALAVAAPVAQAQPAAPTFSVCNQATPTSLGGDLVATDGDPTPPARYKTGLERKPGLGGGLVTAAAHSPALSLCGPAELTPPYDGSDGEDGGDDGSTGGDGGTDPGPITPGGPIGDN